MNERLERMERGDLPDRRDDVRGDHHVDGDHSVRDVGRMTGLGEVLPDPWDWPARVRKDGYLFLRYGSTERPLHRLVYMIKMGLDPSVKYGGRDGETVGMNCEYCGKMVEFGRNVNIDHRDGDKLNCAPGNLVTACIGCNRAKGSEDWTWR